MFRVYGLGFMVSALGFEVSALKFEVSALGFEVGEQESGSRVRGLVFTIRGYELRTNG